MLPHLHPVVIGMVALVIVLALVLVIAGVFRGFEPPPTEEEKRKAIKQAQARH